MKTTLILLPLLILSVACSDKISFKEVKHSSYINFPSDKLKLEFNLNIPSATGEGVSDTINKKVFNTCKSLIASEESSDAIKDYDMLTESFVAEYEKLKKDFPESSLEYKATIIGKVLYNTDKLLNIEISYQIYTGGAHGSSGLISLIFNPKSGKIIPMEKFFNNKNSFTTIAEKKFRTKYNIPENDSINSTGFYFIGNKFHLSNNIFFTKDSLLVHYNSYDIAPYAAGQQKLSFSYNEIKQYLSL